MHFIAILCIKKNHLDENERENEIVHSFYDCFFFYYKIPFSK